MASGKIRHLPEKVLGRTGTFEKVYALAFLWVSREGIDLPQCFTNVLENAESFTKVTNLHWIPPLGYMIAPFTSHDPFMMVSFHPSTFAKVLGRFFPSLYGKRRSLSFPYTPREVLSPCLMPKRKGPVQAFIKVPAPQDLCKCLEKVPVFRLYPKGKTVLFL